MMELTINIPGLKELAEALTLLAGVNKAPQNSQPPAGPNEANIPSPVPQPEQPVQAAVQAVPVQQPTVYQQQMPAQTAAPAGMPVQTPVAPVTPAVPAVPTTAVSQVYTQDQLAVAMTGLMDQGKMQVVLGILSRMGVQALTELPKERYPELVLYLREAGAVI